VKKTPPSKAPPLNAPPLLSNGLRRYLYLTAAATGAAVMVVEILGAKMLSPYVGMSHFVWTAHCGHAVGAAALLRGRKWRTARKARQTLRRAFGRSGLSDTDHLIANR
jgi:hypothetical protein